MRVARATGRNLFALVDAPLVEVLYESFRLDELERHEALARRRAALDLAFLVNYAMHDGKRLERADQEFRASLWAEPHAAGTRARALSVATKQRAAKILRALHLPIPAALTR